MKKTDHLWIILFLAERAKRGSIQLSMNRETTRSIIKKGGAGQAIELNQASETTLATATGTLSSLMFHRKRHN